MWPQNKSINNKLKPAVKVHIENAFWLCWVPIIEPLITFVPIMTPVGLNWFAKTRLLLHQAHSKKVVWRKAGAICTRLCAAKLIRQRHEVRNVNGLGIIIGAYGTPAAKSGTVDGTAESEWALNLIKTVIMRIYEFIGFLTVPEFVISCCCVL